MATQASSTNAPTAADSLDPPAPPSRQWWAALFLCVLTALLRLVWPGDTQWINDEPLFLSKAAALNSGSLLAALTQGAGLHGTVGLTYGPVAVWIFALLLRLSSDLVVVAMLRTALWSALTGVALLWLARLVPRLRPLSLCLILLSPYTWLYSRHLWDNTWLMPLGALAVAAYLSFHAKPRRAPFALAVVALALAVLIHPMVMPLCLVLLWHALRFHRPFLRAQRGLVVGLAGLCLLLAAPWLSYLLQGLWLRLHGAVPPAAGPPPPPVALLPPEPAVSLLAPMLFPFLGGVQLSGLGLGYFVGDDFFAGRSGLAALVAWTAIAHVLVWLGLGLAIQRLREAGREGRLHGVDLHLCLIAVLTFAVQAILHAVLRRHTHPHYYNGSWICAVYFVALSLSSDLPQAWARRLWPRPLRWLLGLSLGLSLSVITLSLALRLHSTGGTRGLHFGATLGNQIEVARTLARYHPDSQVSIEVLNYRLFPHALSLLRQLCGATEGPTGPRQALRIRYRDADPQSGVLIVEPVQTP